MDQKRVTKKIPELPDVHVKVDGRIFPCHRHILASHSRYFEALFAGNFKDAYDDTITLPTRYVSKEGFSVLLKAMYGEEYSMKNDSLLMVFVASSYVNYDHLADKCAKYIARNLKKIIDLVPLISLPQLMDCPSLHDAVIKYSCRHFSEVFPRKRSTCHEVPFHVLEKLLERKDLLIFSAVPALKFCTLWLTECRIEHHHRAKITSLLVPYRKYRASEVVAQCKQYMNENFSAKDMVELFVAFQGEHQPFYEFVKLYLCQNFSKIPTKKLMKISYYRLSYLLRDPSLFDLDECAEYVVPLTRRWFSYHGYNREQFWSKLLRLTEPFENHFA